jgi:hypothetical protein
MAWQLAIVGLMVAVAVLYLLRCARRAWRGHQAGCGGGCACGHKAARQAPPGREIPLLPPEQLKLR